MLQQRMKYFVVLLVLFFLLVLIVGEVMARKWVGDDTLQWTIEDGIVCRDGVVVWAYDDQSIGDPYDYVVGTLLWSRNLDEDTEIVVANPDRFRGQINNGRKLLKVGEVRDCYLNRLTAYQGSSVVIDSQHLNTDNGILDPDINPENTVYRVDTPPTHGAVLLDGSPLEEGDFFTQDDINHNRLTYTHDGSDTIEDSFAYTVATTTRVSVGASGADAHGSSYDPSISAEGRYVAFTSDVPDLVSNDTNSVSDVFHHDLYTGTTIRVSAAASGEMENGSSSQPSISSDGGAVAFASPASNLVSSGALGDCPPLIDDNGVSDVFGHFLDRSSGDSFVAGDTRPLSVDLTPTGCLVAAEGGDSYAPAIYVLDAQDENVVVAFASDATNLADEEDDTPHYTDIFVDDYRFFDFLGGVTHPVSVNSNGVLGNNHSYAPSVSSDSYWTSHIAFNSLASNLVMSDTNEKLDIFVRDHEEEMDDKIVRVSVDSDGAEANDHSYFPSISGNGRFVAFESDATNLVEGDTNGATDIFVHDRDADDDGIYDKPGEVSTTRISIASDGTEAMNGNSTLPSISANGRYVVFSSIATNLVDGDTNELSDIFVHDRQTGQTRPVSIAADGTQANGASFEPAISDDGDYVAFTSFATNLEGNANDEGNVANDVSNVFVHYVGYSSTLSIAIRGNVYVGPGGDGRVQGVAYQANDILAYDPASSQWSLYFDGSDMGIRGNLTDFALLPGGHLLLTFRDDQDLPGLGSVRPQDIVRFVPSSLGENTAGSFRWYFDGSDVGLTRATERVDAITRDANGDLLISVAGQASVPGVEGTIQAANEDLLRFDPTQLGTDTAGSWHRYFDGSEVGLDANLKGVWADPDSGELYLTFGETVTLDGRAFPASTIVRCLPLVLEEKNNTICQFSEYWNGANYENG